jgi:hypothetical protein
MLPMEFSVLTLLLYTFGIVPGHKLNNYSAQKVRVVGYINVTSTNTVKPTYKDTKILNNACYLHENK